MRQRQGKWHADVASILLLAAFVVLAYAIDAVLKPHLDGPGLIVLGIVLALVPAAIWLGFFYRRDRLEPEPRTMVVGVFLLGAFVASAVAIPLVDQVFDVGSWLHGSPVVQLLGAILLVGFTQEGLKYLSLRFSVYNSREFDERTDGVIYATAVGLGFATALNVAFVVGSGGVDLGNGTVRIVLTALAHAGFAGVMGYFLGRQKLEDRPIWWMPLGVSLAAVLNGLFFFLRTNTGGSGLGGPLDALAPWIGLALAAVLAIVVTAVLSRLMAGELAAAEASNAAST